jgi:hypothetical protein
MMMMMMFIIIIIIIIIIMLNLPDITSKFNPVAMFVIVDLQETTFHNKLCRDVY